LREPITCRPADNITPEMHILEQEFDKIVAEKSLTLADNKIDDLLTYLKRRDRYTLIICIKLLNCNLNA
jgi:pyruvate/oxaloacetate carboxyltransferase